MLVPLSWLRDFAPFDLDPVELGAVFDSLGMVVEGIERVGEGLDGVVLGRVLEVAPIEGARVRRTRVDLGDEHGRDVEIVCGAPNVEAGQLVPVAVVGATLPGDFTIAKRKVMGIVSNGMICSTDELGLGGDHGGILVLPDDLGEPGQPFAPAMGIERDVVYDLAIETNRPDANCVAGVARDAAAKLGLPFTIAAVPAVAGTLPAPPVAPVVEAPELSPRFSVTVLEGVTVGPSPSWLARRLTLAGMRPISNLVDISNYVMLELGQPTHPYDLDKLPGGGLRMRAAKAGEQLETLDGVTRTLGNGPSPDGVICDAEGIAVGIAGVMGGASSEIDDGSTRVLLEAAHFERFAIAKTSKRLALRSEASARFERGVDPFGIEASVARFCQLAGELAGAKPTAWAVAESAEHIPARRPIRVRTARVNALLGTTLTDDDVVRLLAPIGFTAEQVEPGLHLVTPPSARLDADLEADVIEEVARHHGYERIPRTVPRSPTVGGLSPHQRGRRLVRDVLVGLGLTEAMGTLLIGPGAHAKAGLPDGEGSVITATDPLAREESVLRRSLRPGLLQAAAFNLARRQDRVPLFEVGHTFRPPAAGATPPLPDEREELAVLLAGADAGGPAAVEVWLAVAAALRLEGVTLEAVEELGLHPTRTARIVAGGNTIGVVGEVDPDVAAAHGIDGRVGVVELDLVALLAAPRGSGDVVEVSKFPSSDVDLAFAVPDAVPAGAVLATLRTAAGELLETVALFDTYRGAGLPEDTRSLAFRLRFSSLERTLTDADVAAARQAAIDAVTATHAATLR